MATTRWWYPWNFGKTSSSRAKNSGSSTSRPTSSTKNCKWHDINGLSFRVIIIRLTQRRRNSTTSIRHKKTATLLIAKLRYRHGARYTSSTTSTTVFVGRSDLSSLGRWHVEVGGGRLRNTPTTSLNLLYFQKCCYRWVCGRVRYSSYTQSMLEKHRYEKWFNVGGKVLIPPPRPRFLGKVPLSAAWSRCTSKSTVVLGSVAASTT